MDNRDLHLSDRRDHFSLRKLTVGVASVLIGTTLYFGLNANVAHAEVTNSSQGQTETQQIVKSNSQTAGSNTEQDTKIESQNQSSNSDSKVQPAVKQSTEPETKKVAAPESNKQTTAPAPEIKKAAAPKVAPDQTESSLKGTAQQYTEGETPELNPSVLNPDDLRKLGLSADNLGDDTKLVWTKAPDVSKVGSTTGTAELTYTDHSAQPDASGNYPVKHVNVNVPVNVRLGQVKKAGQVRNSITYVDEDDNSVVRQYSWVGNKDTQNNGLTEDASAQLESLVTRLGFTVDDEKGDGDQGLDKLIHFGDSDQNLVVYVHELSRQPILLDQNYNVGNYNRQAVVDKNGKVIADPSAVIGNLGDLPYGTVVSWAVAPKYDLTVDPDASNSTTGTVYKNELPINTPVVKVVLPGQKPVYLQLSRPEDKQLVSLPQEGTAMAPVWQAQIEAPIGSTINPRDLITNYDELLNSAFAQTGLPESEEAAYAKYFQDAFTWDVAPDLSQVGDTFGHVMVKPSSEFGPNYLDGSQYMTVLVHVVPRTWTNNNEVTRTIEVVNPITGKTTTTTQKVSFTRTGKQEIVGAPASYGDWNQPSGTWAEFDAPVIKGYAPSRSKVEQKTVKPGDSDQTVEITYNFVPQPIKENRDVTRTITVINPDGTQQVTKQTVTFTRTNTQVDAKGAITFGTWDAGTNGGKWAEFDVPAIPGYKASQAKVEAQKVTPDTKDKTINISYAFVPKQVKESKDVTRTITVINPDGSRHVTTQTVTFTRTNTQVDAKGAITFGSWDAGTNGGKWAEFDAPVIKGYTPSQSKVDQKTVKPTDGDQNVEITYNFVPQPIKESRDVTRTITVINPDGSQHVTIQTVTFKRTNTQVDAKGAITFGSWDAGTNGGKWAEFITPEIKGYKPSQASVAEQVVTPNTKNTPVVITYAYIPKQTTEHKDVTRTIVVTNPDGSQHETTQTVTFTRTNTQTDPQGSIIIGQWHTDNNQWAEYDVPAIPGYKASQAKVLAQKVTPATKDKTINISYAFIPKPVTESKDVTRTIIIINPDGTQTRIPQTVTFTRTNTQTDAKGSIIYGQWDTGTNDGVWAEYTVPKIDGYKANPASIAKQVVTPTTKDTSVVITYAYIPKQVTETKDVSRVIVVVDPITGNQTRTVQTVTFTRTNTQTAADGSMRIGQWNGGSNDGYWNEFDAPEIKGYKPSQAKIDKEKVTPDTKEAVFVITYTKIDSGNTNPGGNNPGGNPGGNTPGGNNPGGNNPGGNNPGNNNPGNTNPGQNNPGVPPKGENDNTKPNNNEQQSTGNKPQSGKQEQTSTNKPEGEQQPTGKPAKQTQAKGSKSTSTITEVKATNEPAGKGSHQVTIAPQPEAAPTKVQAATKMSNTQGKQSENALPQTGEADMSANLVILALTMFGLSAAGLMYDSKKKTNK